MFAMYSLYNNGMIQGIKDIISNFKAHFILYMKPNYVSVKEYETVYQYNWLQTPKGMFINTHRIGDASWKRLVSFPFKIESNR